MQDVIYLHITLKARIFKSLVVLELLRLSISVNKD